MARWFIIIGVLFVIVGLLLSYAPWALNWFGKLPGDIRYQSEQTNIFIPITSMVILSLVISILINVFKN